MKKILVLTLVLCVVSTVLFAGGEKEEGKGTIAFTIQDLTNPTWAQTNQELERLTKADGYKYVYSDTKNPSDQLTKFESLIADKTVKAIVVHPYDANQLDPAIANAKKAGIKVYSWDTPTKEADINWIISNYELGQTIGKEAAKWINEKLGGKADVALVRWDAEPILLERGNGIEDAIRANAPSANIVGFSTGRSLTEAQPGLETLVQANPNLKVIAAIGDGGGMAGVNALKGANKISPETGIFSADATAEVLQAIEKGDQGYVMSVMITGGPKKNAEVIYGFLKQLLAGEKVPQDQLRALIPITKANIDLAK